MAFDLNEKPQVGLPTPQAPSDNKGHFAQLKRQMRMKRMHTEDPNFGYLIETVSNLARAIKNTQNQLTIHMLD